MKRLRWEIQLRLTRRLYRLARRTHSPADPLCERATSAAIRLAIGRGINCQPCAERRRWLPLLQQMEEDGL